MKSGQLRPMGLVLAWICLTVGVMIECNTLFTLFYEYATSIWTSKAIAVMLSVSFCFLFVSAILYCGYIQNVRAEIVCAIVMFMLSLYVYSLYGAFGIKLDDTLSFNLSTIVTTLISATSVGCVAFFSYTLSSHYASIAQDGLSLNALPTQNKTTEQMMIELTMKMLEKQMLLQGSFPTFQPTFQSTTAPIGKPANTGNQAEMKNAHYSVKVDKVNLDKINADESKQKLKTVKDLLSPKKS